MIVQIDTTTICGTDLHILRGDVVAVVGAGPVGLAAIMTAGLSGAARVIALDLDDNRLRRGARPVRRARAAGPVNADVAITMGLVSTSSTPMLLKLVAQHRLAAERFATHHFGLDEMLEAYDTVDRAAETQALRA